jgi:hypothetical protein
MNNEQLAMQLYPEHGHSPVFFGRFNLFIFGNNHSRKAFGCSAEESVSKGHGITRNGLFQEYKSLSSLSSSSLSCRRISRNSSLERLMPSRLNRPSHCLMASIASCFVMPRGNSATGLKSITIGPAGISRGTSIVNLWLTGTSTVCVTLIRKI